VVVVVEVLNTVLVDLLVPQVVLVFLLVETTVVVAVL
jgi:hypothetical protein